MTLYPSIVSPRDFPLTFWGPDLVIRGYYLLCMAAGILLLENRPLGRHLTFVALCLQVPYLSTHSVSWELYSGVTLELAVSNSKLSLLGGLGSYCSVRLFAADRQLVFGVNLAAAGLVGLLVLASRLERQASSSRAISSTRS